MLVDIIQGDPKLPLNRCNATYLPFLQQPLLENLGQKAPTLAKSTWLPQQHVLKEIRKIQAVHGFG